MSFKKNKEKSNDALNTEINRIAIDLSGRLGSLYDAYRDRVLEQLNIFRPEPTNHTLRLIRCNRIKGKHDSSKNILKIMSFEQELRLSILLNLSKNMEKPTIIDYFYPTNEYTRFIQYSSLNREENLPDIPSQITILDTPSTLFNDATHIITKVHFGIDFTVVIQLPTITNIVVEIDHTLDKLCIHLQNHHNTDSLTIHDKSLLEQIVYTKVYSNIPHLRNLTTIYDVYCYLQENKNNSVDYPIFYTLKLIKEFYPQYNGEIVKVNLLSKELNDIIEDYVLQRTTDMKQLEKSIIEDMPKILCKHLKQRFACIETQWFDVKKIFTNEIKRIANLVVRIRSGEAENLFTEQIFNDKEQMMIKNSIDELTQNVKHLEEKEHFIRCLNQQNFQYLNIIDYNIDQTDNENSIEHKLVQNHQHYRILCSNDYLNKNNSEELHKLICGLMEEAKNNSSLHLIYADFSDCSFPLSTMMVFPSLKTTHEDIIDQSSSVLSTVSFSKPKLPTDQPTSTSMSIDKTINIVLLGETGVGKSTFINAFANYLTFASLKQVESSKPVVLIPVSFLMTVGDNFEEHIVKFGDIDDSNNEDFDHPGQSVTQHCKSYVFHLNGTDRKKLRIIDTPGFDDTRGIEQDDLNMEHILEYVNNLSHLNAICFLLKPNASRLNISFRSCFTQLFSLLDQNALNHIIFCFTNSRSTFYTPGDTAPLLKKMLISLSIGNVPFKKENTFCFDSGSFRYLIALQNRIEFNGDERQKYEMSWSTSVTQSNRLIDYIGRNLDIYRIDNNLQSMKHAQYEINHMIRPMLETMRNILRNLILYRMDSLKTLIELRPKVNHCPSTRCLVCKPTIHLVGIFSIAYYQPHVVQKDCRSCDCSSNQHIPMSYMLDYECSKNGWNYNEREMIDMIHELCNISAEFAHFLIHVVCSTKDDPFLIGFVEMIIEENDIYNSQTSNRLNLQLANDLRNLKNKYEQRFNEIHHLENYRKLSNIYYLINNINKYPMIREQLAAVKEGQKIMMKQHEYEIPRISCL